MMARVNLGSIDRVPLREVWPHEALDFTRWMAEEENLSLLGEAVGIELELRETESSVGGFSVDIFATESGTGRKIIIENQLEETNHDHLGKIITYAAGKNAQAVIWVVARARDEHRQAIEWLNQHTDDESSFFLVEVEVWRIGDSLPAVRFNIVESPNDWAKAEKAKSGLTDTQKVQLEYWQTYYETALSQNIAALGLKPCKPQPYNWSNIHVGTSQYHIELSIKTYEQQIGICFYVPDNKELGRAAQSHLAELEEAVGVKGKYNEAQKASTIRFYKEGRYDVANKPDKWPELISWQIDSAVKLYQAINSIGL